MYYKKSYFLSGLPIFNNLKSDKNLDKNKNEWIFVLVIYLKK